MSHLVHAAALGVAFTALGCGYREPVPAFREQDARFGRLAGAATAPSKDWMCRSWSGAILARDAWASAHVSFPETNVQNACCTPVHHEGREVHAAAPPRGCGYPGPAQRAPLLALAEELERLAASPTSHRLFPCTLAPDALAAAALHNARVLRSLAASTQQYPYAGGAGHVALLGDGDEVADLREAHRAGDRLRRGRGRARPKRYWTPRRAPTTTWGWPSGSTTRVPGLSRAAVGRSVSVGERRRVDPAWRPTSTASTASRSRGAVW